MHPAVHAVTSEHRSSHGQDATTSVAGAAGSVSGEYKRESSPTAVSPREEDLHRHADSHREEVDCAAQALLDRVGPVDHGGRKDSRRPNAERDVDATPARLAHAEARKQ